MYYIPDVKLVGYGRTQSYQISCLSCRGLHFPYHVYREPVRILFCEDCDTNEQLITDLNMSEYKQIGNVIGWVVKLDHIERNRSRWNYQKVYKRDAYICQYCGYSPYYCEEFRALHIDHVLPWSARGSNLMMNLVVSCEVCNCIAGNGWFNTFADKKQFILDKLKVKKIKTYFELKIKFRKTQLEYVKYLNNTVR